MDETNQLPTGTECPQCNTKMRTFMVQSRNPNKDVELDRCHGCGGVWFDAGELELSTGRTVAAGKTPVKDRYCPRCLIPLLEATLTGGIAVENCRHCKGTYLDAKDLAICARAAAAKPPPPDVSFACDSCKQRKPFAGAETTPNGTWCADCLAKKGTTLDAQAKEKTSMFKAFVGWLRGDK
ncbi:MAG: zf-TFIIB domain-containing protein [Archangium sp.]|nr:zf-TFIIB domain-containing protein [Archangium sp.]